MTNADDELLSPPCTEEKGGRGWKQAKGGDLFRGDVAAGPRCFQYSGGIEAPLLERNVLQES